MTHVSSRREGCGERVLTEVNEPSVEDERRAESCPDLGVDFARRFNRTRVLGTLGVAGKVAESESEPAVYLPIDADTRSHRSSMHNRVLSNFCRTSTKTRQTLARVSRPAVSRFFPSSIFFFFFFFFFIPAPGDASVYNKRCRAQRRGINISYPASDIFQRVLIFLGI